MLRVPSPCCPAWRAFAVVSAAACVLGAGSGCAPDHVVSLLDRGMPTTGTPLASIPLEVVTHSTAVDDPLPVRGEDESFADLETALGTSVSSAAAPWAESHRSRRPTGWQLSVELIQAEAVGTAERLVVGMTVRATLRARADGNFLGQTQASCHESGLVPPGRGSPVVLACMSRIGRDLAAWLAATVDTGDTGDTASP